MTTSVSVWGRPKLASEYPSNGLSLTVEFDQGLQVCIYLDGEVEFWWQLRQTLEKAESYSYTAGGACVEHVKDHKRADKLAELFYFDERTREAKRRCVAAEREVPAPPPPAEDPDDQIPF